MTETWLPGAHVHDLHPAIGNGPFSHFLGLVLHVNVDEYGTPDSFWGNGNPGQVSPNFQVYKDGTIHQMLPLNWQPWCQVDGNFNYAAVETAGMPNEPLTKAQVAAIAKICKAYHDQMGMPLTVANSPGQRGLGIHSMGGQAWGGHSCPGTIRANQRSAILALAKGSSPAPTPPKDWFDMATQADLEAVVRKVLAEKVHARTTDLVGDAKGAGHLAETFFQGVPGYKTLAQRGVRAVEEPVEESTDDSATA